jgi:hypothetical protein
MKQLMGIITLEDIIECLLGTQIMDEGDSALAEMVANRWSSGAKGGTKIDARIKLLSAERNRISEDVEMNIIINHLLENVRPFQIKRHGYQISEYALTHLVRDSEIKTFKRGQIVWSAGGHSDSMLLVLDGTLVTETGRDKFKSVAGNLSTIGDGALAYPEDSNWFYTPDFTVTVSSSKSRVLVIKRDAFIAAYNMTKDRDIQALKSILATNQGSNTSLQSYRSKNNSFRELQSASSRSLMSGSRATTIAIHEQRSQIKDPGMHKALL